ncbi:MAG: S8 family serine peptidase [candidate division Zixibacteria bacterium]|nr:S8 family serine peptidase [candidate division Zixibacteria bacterium]
MKRGTVRILGGALLLSVFSTGIGAAAEKIKIEKLDDLPRHVYKISVDAVDLSKDDAALTKLIKEVKADLESDLETYEIQDKTTLKSYYGNLGIIAMLEGRYDDCLHFLELRRELEDKEAARLTAGLFSQAYIRAVQSGARDRTAAIKKEYRALVLALPYKTVEAEMKSAKARYETVSQNLLEGIIESRIQPALDASGGEISKDFALSLIGFNYTIRNYLPYKRALVEVLTAYLDEHRVEKLNIWNEREVTLKASDKGSPVVVAIWDAGIDTDLFKGQLWTNDKEIPGNNIDDDGNGFIDDVHGIAYTLHSDKTTEMLYPIGDVEKDRPRLQRLLKGLEDMNANIDSDEATELKNMLSSMDKADVQPLLEDIGKYGNYSHGTHVAGVTVQGNPFVRLLNARITFEYRMVPEEPTVEQALKDSAAALELVDYLKKSGVRVANLSWGGNLASFESALEIHNAGGSADERKALARRIFEIQKQGLYGAIKDAPEILFITSAGNTDADVSFEEFIPSSLDLPNTMTVGAVDQAGNETGFTSFGKVDVYANGFEVTSYVPGGDKMTMSGTSQASPNATNLAAKLLALRPDLTPVQVRELIEKGCDEKMAGERVVRLINPKKSIELLSNVN